MLIEQSLFEVCERSDSKAASDNAQLTLELQRLSIGNERRRPEVPRVDESTLNCAASCSNDSNRMKRYRNAKKSEVPKKIVIQNGVIRKRSLPTTPAQFRPRARSIGSAALLKGAFGPACRKVMSRRRKSFSNSSRADDARGSADIDCEDGASPSVTKACGQEAYSPDMADFSATVASGEVDELSEYFAHFVNVRLKMSALAESMYV